MYFGFLGKSKLKFVARQFVCPPREFRLLYGPEVRQTTIDSFVVKMDPEKLRSNYKKKSKLVQTRISSFFAVQK